MCCDRRTCSLVKKYALWFKNQLHHDFTSCRKHSIERDMISSYTQKIRVGGPETWDKELLNGIWNGVGMMRNATTDESPRSFCWDTGGATGKKVTVNKCCCDNISHPPPLSTCSLLLYFNHRQMRSFDLVQKKLNNLYIPKNCHLQISPQLFSQVSTAQG